MTPEKVTRMQELATEIRDNPAFADKVRTDRDTAAELVREFLPDTPVYRLVIIGLGLALTLSVIGAIWITLAESTGDMPDILIATASGAVGALAGLLNQT